MTDSARPDVNTPPSRHDSGPAGDEISLVDLAATLWEHKWLLVGVTGLCVLLGLGYALTREPVYEYSTTIELGTFLEGNRFSVIEHPQNVVAKLQNSHVPEAIRIYQQELKASNRNGQRLHVAVSNPRDTNLIMLFSTGTEALREYYIPLQELILQRLVEDHARTTLQERIRLENDLEQARIELDELEDERVLQVVRKQFEFRIAEARSELSNLSDRESLLRQELENLDVQVELIGNRLEELAVFVGRARDRRQTTVDDVKTGTDSMALMLIDSELQRDIDRQVEFEERLLVTIPERRATLRNQLEENQRNQALQRETISALEGEYEKLLLDQGRAIARHLPVVKALETRLEYLHETHAVLPPRQSLRPVNISSTLIIALSIILGGLLGMLAVSIAVLVRATREKLLDRS